MTGAMYAGISGMKAHMSKLNVIGNNIANVNTYGFKNARTTFRETIYTTINSGSNGTTLTGGVNPNQLGYGCNVGTVDMDMATATAVPTGVNLDCMIQGDSFFLVGDKAGVDTDSLERLSLTKVGDFKFDTEGYLVDSSGNIVYGFVACNTQADGTVNTEAGSTGAPGFASVLVPIQLPMRDKDGKVLYPGYTEGNNAVTEATLSADSGADGGAVGRATVNTDSISIDQGGKITATTTLGDPVVIGTLALGKVDNSAGLTHISGPYYTVGEGAGSLYITTPNASSVGPYLNGVKEGDATEGAVSILQSSDTLLTGFLEGSGTDLATEFSEMITTQRGYQANTRIITVTDSMLEELVNIKL